MDKNELRQRLEQVAELKDRAPVRSPNHRLAIEYITEIDDQGEEYQVPVEIKDNPTLGYELVRLKDQHRLCELGCGEITTNQVIEIRRAVTPQKHWRTRCKTCDKYIGPDGKSFIKGSHAVQHAFSKYFNSQKGTATPIESPDDSTRTIETDEYTEIITNNNIIRRYK